MVSTANLHLCNKVKNDATLTTKALAKVRRQHTVLLTGTPLQNNLRELYCLLSFLAPVRRCRLTSG